MKKCIEEYCSGCGICSMIDGEVEINSKGFWAPKEIDEEWASKICPSGGAQCSKLEPDNIWGRTMAVYRGWSSDDRLRKQASSGGVLTELAAFLLEQKAVDGVIHIRANENDPTENVSCVSHSREELVSRCGSRYSISHPLEILNQIDQSKRYVFIGKPCDVTALTNFLDNNPEWKNIIIYKFAFFCAGMPSVDAQKKLLETMGCRHCVSLRYRGDGWPGYTTAINQKKQKFRLDYGTSWGKILGRDTMKFCRLCLDGIGELADIACGDAWYLKEDGTPDFSEHDGRNVIFSRTEKGEALLTDVAARGKIHLENYTSYKTELPKIQKYQYERKITMLSKIMALKICFKPVPNYPVRLLIRYSKHASIKMQLRIFLGTIKRVMLKKI